MFNELTLLSKVVKVVFPPKFAIMGALGRKRVTTSFKEQILTQYAFMLLVMLTWTIIPNNYVLHVQRIPNKYEISPKKSQLSKPNVL